jgi:hypothetical protein
MADNEFAGSACYVQWVWSGGTVVLSTESRNFSYTPSKEYIDVTAGQDTNRKRLPSFGDGQASLEYTAQSDGTVTLAALAEGVHGTLTWGVAGTATGKPKQFMAAYSNGVTEANPYADVATWTLSWMQDGSRTDSAW